MRTRVLASFAVATIAAVTAIAAQYTVAPPPALHGQAAPAETSRWKGEWAGNGFLYVAELTLNVRPDGALEGSILWKIETPGRPEEAAKVGIPATEFVRGRYLAEHGLLVFEGHAKDDPNLVIGLDRYRLLVANGGDALTGITHSHGTWQGRFTASRVEGRLPPPPAPKGGSGEK